MERHFEIEGEEVLDGEVEPFGNSVPSPSSNAGVVQT